MSYKFDEKIIYDDEAMWDLAITFKSHYDFILEQVKRSELNKPFSSIIYKGEIVMQWHENYKKVLSNYKNELKFMDDLLEFKLTQKGNRLEKYVNIDI